MSRLFQVPVVFIVEANDLETAKSNVKKWADNLSNANAPKDTNDWELADYMLADKTTLTSTHNSDDDSAPASHTSLFEEDDDEDDLDEALDEEDDSEDVFEDEFDDEIW